MKKLLLLAIVLSAGCVSRISIEDGCGPKTEEETPSLEEAVQQVAPSEQA